MMTMQSQYKSKVPSNNKKFKKKETTSTTTFRKNTNNQNNYLTLGPGEALIPSKNKSSRSRLATVDSKGKLVSVKDSKNIQDIGANTDASDRPSSGKKKKSSSKKQNKAKIPNDFTQRTFGCWSF